MTSDLPSDGVVDGIRSMPLDALGAGVEIKGEGGYVILPPSHLDDGRAYTRLNGDAVAEAPDWLLARIEAYARGKAGNGAKNTPAGDRETPRVPLSADAMSRLLAKLATIPADAEPIWIRIGAALYDALGEAGWEVYDAWSRTSAKYADGGRAACRAKWEHAKTWTNYTVATIYGYGLKWTAGTPLNVRDAPLSLGEMITATTAVVPSKGLGEWDPGLDTAPIPPRQWLFGRVFCRKFISTLLGDGAVGKTALRYAQLMSSACGRSLTGERIWVRCRVLIVSLEDDVDELRRRIEATRQHHNVRREELEGHLFLAAPGQRGGKLLEPGEGGKLARGELADLLDETIARREIDIVSLDPFIKTHG